MAQTRSQTRQDSGAARIASGTRVRGRIAGDGDLTVDGEVEGEIALRGVLTVGDGASVTSESIEAESVTIEGKLEGNVTASGPVRVASGARVRGNMKGSAVSIDEGAEFAGRLDCDFELPPELRGSPSRDR